MAAGPLRDVVAADIERSALLEAKAILSGSAYLPPLTSSAARDDHCRAVADASS